MDRNDEELYFLRAINAGEFQLRRSGLVEILPGVGVSVIVTLMSQAIAFTEKAVFGYELMDALVFAILLGTIYHSVVGLAPSLRAGVDFSSKLLLEMAIVLLGASISVRTVVDAGTMMVAVVFATVMLSLVISYSICRLLGLTDHLATLVACGNSICGNSAIVAAAPVIGADFDDVASSIAFTAALGILVVLLLPWLFSAFGMTQWQYGVFAGMTVYAVPQVLAATAPIGAASVQVGTLVKLMRVLMLGPVVLLLRLKNGGQRTGGAWLSATRLVPWFIVGFFAMMCLRSLGLIPPGAVDTAKSASTILTTVSMAALGLSVNMRTVFASGGRVLLAGVLSLAAMSLLGVVGLLILQAR